ncbi:hypothetical protein [Desulfosporosinus sp. SB140]|uniref:hypothetical protein n=1 Tax=Desulfosporosinus paludis TaxID=3115649 RepID=UPI00388DD53F
MKTQEELQHELFMQTSEVESALLKLDKANMLLGHWMHEYAFREIPDPYKAIQCQSTKSPEERSKKEQHFKWFYDYTKIVGFIDIVADYVYESRILLEKVVNGKEDNAA